MAEKLTYEELEQRIRVLEQRNLESSPTEKQFQGSEEQFKMLADYAPVQISIIALEDETRYLYVNKEWEKVIGYSKDEMDFVKPIDIVHPDLQQTVFKKAQKRLNGHNVPERYELRVVTKSGEIKTLDFSAIPITYDNKKAILTTATDLTERKQAEDALIDSETLFRGMFKDHSAVMLLIAPDTGQIIKANLAAAQYYGYSLEKMLQMKIQQLNVLSPTEVAEQMQCALNKQLNSFEFQHLLADGKVRNVEVHSSPIIIQNQALLFSIVHDITERKKAEDELLDSEKLLSQSQEIGHIGSWKLDFTENSLIWSNEIYRIFGYEPYEFPITYEAFLDVVHPDEREMVNNAYTDSIREGRNEYEIQHRIIRPNTSEIRTIHERCIHERDEAGNIVRSVGIAQDITEQKRAEEALRREEERFRTLVENTVDWIWQVDTGCRYIYVSPQAEELLGYSRNEILGKTPFDFMSADEVQRVTPIFLKAIEKRERIIELEDTLLAKDGSQVVFETNATPLFEKDGNIIGYMGTCRDITERKKNEIIIEKKNNDLRLAQSIASLGTWTLDPEIGVPEWSGEIYHIYERDPNLGPYPLAEYKNIFKGEWWERFSSAIQGAITKGIPYDIELKLEFPSGKEKWVHAICDPDPAIGPKGHKLRGTIQDITEKRQATLALEESKNRYESIYQNAQVGLSRTRIRDGKVLECNQKMADFFGYESINECVAEGILSDRYVDKGIREKTLAELHQTGFIQNKEARFYRKDGHIIWARFDSRIFPEYGYMEDVIIDITEHKRMQARIEQAQKMEAVGNLAGGIAHDFNNILFPIIGMSDLMLEDLEPDSMIYEDALEINRAGKRAKDLVSQILSFSRQTEHEMMPVKFQKIIKEVLKLCRSTIPMNIRIEQNIQQDCGSIWANATQLHQIVMNLVTNAYHAVQDKNGNISVALKEMILGKNDLSTLAVSPGKYAVFSVSDNGIGMSKEIQGKVFEPYFTTKEKGKGTGLGLAVVYGIVKNFKGDIQLYSEVGSGTTFNIFLPLMEKNACVESENINSEIQTGEEHILFVDDEPSITRLVQLTLERLGYTVSVSGSSIEALETFKKNPDKYDMILSDMSMPHMTGDQLAREIRRIRPEIPIIICTGFSERINKKKAEEIGVNGFLMKPIMRAELAGTVRKVLDGPKGDTCA